MNVEFSRVIWILMLSFVLLMISAIDADDDVADKLDSDNFNLEEPGKEPVRFRKGWSGIVDCGDALKNRVLTTCREERDAAHPELAGTPFISERMAKVFLEIDSQKRVQERTYGGILEECCVETECTNHEIREKC